MSTTGTAAPAIYCPNCEATGFPPSGHSWPSLEPWWIDGAKLCCTECGACLVVRADGERASLELDEPEPAERKPPTWIPHPDGGECLAIPGDPGVHLGVWVNPEYGPHWSVAFDKQGCFPRHAETLDEAKADAIAHAERELSAVVTKGEEAARVLAVLRGEL